ncbi:MAG TPA: DoxX family protein [Gemmatimonadales bacterium]|nr:DoxX family protein [Gemmatimonadales bacterium]
MNRFSPYAALVLRLATGGVFLHHGIMKLQHGLPGLADWLHTLGFPFAIVWAGIVVAVETLGAACVIAGLFTRAWAACMAVEMTVAILRVLLPGGRGFELEGMLLASALALVALGDGPFALAVGLKRGT